MHDTHPAALAIMIASSLVAAGCAVAAGRAVPWQGRQAAVVMAAGMIALVVPAVDAPAVLVAAVWTLSAMVGTAGLGGRPEAGACLHRSIGTVAMALCLMGGAVRMPGTGAAVGGVHLHAAGSLPALPLLAAAAVLGMLVWTIAGAHVGPRGAVGTRPRVLLRIEAWAMTVGLLAMWLGHAG